MRVSFATESVPNPLTARYLFIGVASGCFLFQGLVLVLAQWVDSFFAVILLPVVGIFLMITPRFQEVPDKEHWSVILTLLLALMITSLLYAGLFVGLGKLGTWLGCRG